MSSIPIASTEKSIPGRAVQIISIANHSFRVELEQLNRIFDKNELKDRHVVVVSIAGAFRKGKSFLLNFFLKYLNAQYKKHDTTDWIGEKDSGNELFGFKWRGGSLPETSGIWIWSEIFTHDFENGDKVAIILLDTQGIFDYCMTLKECSTIFSLSMLTSSVQCFNLMQHVQEIDLQHLSLFTEYGQLSNHSDQIAFQKLLFIVRDWPYADECGYGWSGKGVVDAILAGNDKHTPGMLQIRKSITSSFEEISEFLLPYPGNMIAQGNSSTGAISQIDSTFLKYVKDLVPELLAPDRLIVKKINYEKVRVCDFVKYFQAYSNAFNANTLPEPRSILQATADTSNLILHNVCLNYYNHSMQNSLNENTFLALHQNVAAESIKQNCKIEETEPQISHSSLFSSDLHSYCVYVWHQIFLGCLKFSEKRKLGGSDMALPFLQKLEKDIKERFDYYKHENIMKRNDFTEKAYLHNKKIRAEIKMESGRKISKEVTNDRCFTLASIRSAFEIIRKFSLEQFDRDKMGNDEYSDNYREILARDLDNIGYTLFQTWQSYDQCLSEYNVLMKGLFDRNATFFTDTDLINVHRKSRDETLPQFLEKVTKLEIDELSYAFELRIRTDFETKFKYFAAKNEEKKITYNEVSFRHNMNLFNTIIGKFREHMHRGIGEAYLEQRDFNLLFLEQKMEAFKTFDTEKRGDNETYANLRRKLEQNIDDLRDNFFRINESNQSGLLKCMSAVTGGAFFGASIGKFFGPEGLYTGAIIGGVIGGVAGAGVGISILVRKAIKAKTQ